jgi:ribosome-binding factor A
MKEETIRQLKFGREVQRILADVLQRDVEGLGHTLITITAVKVSPDLQMCRVYITCLPAKETKLIVDLLNEENRKIRGLLSRRIKDQVRTMPNLKFFFDDTLESAQRINDIFARIEAQDAAHRKTAAKFAPPTEPIAETDTEADPAV